LNNQDKVNLIPNVDPAKTRIPSMTVDFTGNRLRIIREESIDYDELLSVVNKGY